jgi:hypothetical protein
MSFDGRPSRVDERNDVATRHASTRSATRARKFTPLARWLRQRHVRPVAPNYALDLRDCALVVDLLRPIAKPHEVQLRLDGSMMRPFFPEEQDLLEARRDRREGSNDGGCRRVSKARDDGSRRGRNDAEGCTCEVRKGRDPYSTSAENRSARRVPEGRCQSWLPPARRSFQRPILEQWNNSVHPSTRGSAHHRRGSTERARRRGPAHQPSGRLVRGQR